MCIDACSLPIYAKRRIYSCEKQRIEGLLWIYIGYRSCSYTLRLIIRSADSGLVVKSLYTPEITINVENSA